MQKRVMPVQYGEETVFSIQVNPTSAMLQTRKAEMRARYKGALGSLFLYVYIWIV